MKLARTLLSALWLAAAQVAFAQEAQQPPRSEGRQISEGSETSEGFQQLERDWARALREWRAALEAACAEGLLPGERPDHPASGFWARYEAAGAAGEGRAVLWMLEHLCPAADSTDVRRARSGRILALVEGAGEAPWVGEALLALSGIRGDLDEGRLQALVNSLAQDERPIALRGAALLARAEGLEREDRDRAQLIRLKLVRASLEQGLTQQLSSAVREALTRALVGDLEARKARHFAEAYEERDGSWARREDAPLDPEDEYRPLIEGLAEAGSDGARVWFLTETRGLQGPSAERAARYLDALERERLSASDLARLVRRTSSLMSLDPPRVEARMLELVRASPESELPGLLVSLGKQLCVYGGRSPHAEPGAEASTAQERGRALLREVIERWPNSTAARGARLEEIVAEGLGELADEED